jgi:hypothetical protein
VKVGLRISKWTDMAKGRDIFALNAPEIKLSARGELFLITFRDPHAVWGEVDKLS